MKSQNTFSGIKIKNLFSRILDVLILFVFILFFASAGFQDKNTSGWYQQFFPNMNGSSITSITFLDSLTGFAVTSTNSSVQGYIIKTTNGGDNWSIIYTYVPPSVNSGFRVIQFANDSIGYAATNYFTFFKTTNAGLNWIQLTTPDGAEGMAVINKDTLLVVTSDGFAGGVYRTTNGGYNWQALGPTGGSGQPSTIYMYNKDMGFCLGGEMRKTTNGGVNWFAIPGETYTSIKFVDSLTGWKVYDSLKKTTNGGINWVTQRTPSFSSYFSNSTSFSILNKDTVWMVGARNFGRPPVYKTTNGGINWGYQFPDTTLQFYSFRNISFVNKLNGWVYPASISIQSEFHTTIGGNDTTYITNIKNNITSVSKDYDLFQNYPNPFNANSNIKYKISKSSNIKVEIMNILGRNIITLVNEKQNPGTYEVRFDGESLCSGVYFYSLYADGIIIDTKRALLIK